MPEASRPVVLQIRDMPRAIEQALDAAYEVHRMTLRDAAGIAAVAPRVRALVTGSMVGATAALIDAMPALEIIACFGVGVDTIDVAHAKAKGIPVANTPDVLNEDVADMAIALMLAASRRVAAADAFVRRGEWLRGAAPLSHRVHGKRAGIVGLGRIGLEIARRCEGFRMSVAYHGPGDKHLAGYRYHADLCELARSVDFLVLACPGGEATRHLVGREVLAALGPAGILVNVARGSVVDETALIDALAARTIRGAGIDVYADEPRAPSALFGLDNVVLSPHCASGTHETRAAMGQLVLDNLAAHFAGEPLPTPL